MISLFRRAWAGWKKFAFAFGSFQTKVVLTLFYGIAVCPLGFFTRMFSDPLRLKKPAGAAGWRARETRDRTVDDLRRQF